MSIKLFSAIVCVGIFNFTAGSVAGGFDYCTPENSNPASDQYNPECVSGMINAKNYRGGQSVPGSSEALIQNVAPANQVAPSKIPQGGVSKATANATGTTDRVAGKDTKPSPDEDPFSDLSEDAQRANVDLSGKPGGTGDTGGRDGYVSYNGDGLPNVESGHKGMITALATVKIVDEKLAAISPKITKMFDKLKSCGADSKLSAQVCMESSSPALTNSSMLITMMLGTARQVASAHDACSNISKALDIAQKGFMAFQLACGSAKLNCDMSCGTGAQLLKDIDAQVNSLVPDLRMKMKLKRTQDLKTCAPNDSACVSNINSSYVKAHQDFVTQLGIFQDTVKRHINGPAGSLGATAKTCSGYGATLAQAGTGTIMMIASASSSNNCEKKTGNSAPPDCNKVENKFNISCINKTANLNCKDPINANNQNCICANSPNTPGCPGAISISGGASGLDIQNGGGGNGARTPSNTGGIAARLDASAPDANIAGPTDTGAAKSIGGNQGGGAPGGGGGGLGGGGTSNLNSDQANKATAAGGYDTSVIGGDFGSGGAAYGGAAYADAADNSHLGSYLPGGKNDPSAVGGAAAAAWAKEVSGPGGKSNWEKVRDRYNDNGYSLITP